MSNKSKCNVGKTHSKEEKYIKSLDLSPLRKDPIPNHETLIIGLYKDQCLTPDVPTFLPGNKIILNENDDNPETTDNLQYENLIYHILNELILLQ